MGIYWALTAYQLLINPSPQHCFYLLSNPMKQSFLSPFYWWENWGLGKRSHLSSVLSIKELNQLVSHLCSGCFQLPLLKGIWPFAIISSFLLFWFSYLISKIIQYLSYIMLSYTAVSWADPDNFSPYNEWLLPAPIADQNRHGDFHQSHVFHNFVKVVLSTNVRVHLEASFIWWNNSLFSMQF